jgi:hypothetical protein
MVLLVVVLALFLVVAVGLSVGSNRGNGVIASLPPNLLQSR